MSYERGTSVAAQPSLRNRRLRSERCRQSPRPDNGSQFMLVHPQRTPAGLNGSTLRGGDQEKEDGVRRRGGWVMRRGGPELLPDRDHNQHVIGRLTPRIVTRVPILRHHHPDPPGVLCWRSTGMRFSDPCGALRRGLERRNRVEEKPLQLRASAVRASKKRCGTGGGWAPLQLRASAVRASKKRRGTDGGALPQRDIERCIRSESGGCRDQRGRALGKVDLIGPGSVFFVSSDLVGLSTGTSVFSAREKTTS